MCYDDQCLSDTAPNNVCCNCEAATADGNGECCMFCASGNGTCTRRGASCPSGECLDDICGNSPISGGQSPAVNNSSPAGNNNSSGVFVLQAAGHRRQHHVLRRLHHPHVHLKRHVPGHEREPGLRGCAGRWRRRRSYCAVGWWRWRGSAEIRRQSCDQAVIHRDCRCRWTTYSRCYVMSRWRTRRKQLV